MSHGLLSHVGAEGDVVGIAVDAAGLLYHPRCYVCADCNGPVQGEPATTAPTVAPTTTTTTPAAAAAEPLSLLGASLYCARHCGARTVPDPTPTPRQPHELGLEVFRSMTCQTLAADGVRGFMHEQVRRYAQLAMAVAGKQKQEEAAAAAAAMKSVPPAGAGGKSKSTAPSTSFRPFLTRFSAPCAPCAVLFRASISITC